MILVYVCTTIGRKDVYHKSEVLEGDHGSKVVRLLGRPLPFVGGAELFVLDNDGGAEEGRVVGALARVLVHRRRPPPTVAQLLQQ